MTLRGCFFCAVVAVAAGGSVDAQTYSGDARQVAMGGAGYTDNVAARLAGSRRPYGSIVVPLGLIQMLQDRNRFNPDSDNFDPVLAMEYAANPLHYVFGRDPGASRGRFVRDVINGDLTRDLNDYRGFTPTTKLTAEGLAAPNWGKTFKFVKRDSGAYHGFYVGAGPYLSAKTELAIDQALSDVLGSPTPVSIPNRTFSVTDGSAGQIALALTGGYRGSIALPHRSGRDGLYIGGNFHYLRGFRYAAANLAVRFDTDQNGLLTVLPNTVPATVGYYSSHSGTGYAVDLGVMAVLDRLELGLAVNGIGNRINWQNPELRTYTLQSLVAGEDFVEPNPPTTTPELRVELPVDYTASGAYHWEKRSVVAEAGHGFEGSRVRGGLEWRLGTLELRGGGGYALERWYPSGGVGIRLSERVSLDLAVFGSTLNLERQLRPAFAASIRIGRGW